MDSDLAKTLLQGGWLVTAVKHEQPKCVWNNSPFYITTNAVPEFGKEMENVERRIAVYETQSLPRTTAGVDKWIYEHAMDCLVWTANEITANIDDVPRNERWYENTHGQPSVIDDNDIGRSLFDWEAVKNISSQDLREMELETDASRPSPTDSCAVHRSFVRDEEHKRLAAARALRRRSLLSTSESEEDQLGRRLNDDEEPCESSESLDQEETETEAETRTSTKRKVVESEESDVPVAPVYVDMPQLGWELNDATYMAKVYENIRWKFPTYKLPQRPTLAFSEKREAARKGKDKSFLTKPDPYIDAWSLLTGKERNVFDVTAFVKMYPDVEKYMLPTRNMLKCRVFSDSCPIQKAKRSLLVQNMNMVRREEHMKKQSGSENKISSPDKSNAFQPRCAIVVKRARRIVRK